MSSFFLRLHVRLSVRISISDFVAEAAEAWGRVLLAPNVDGPPSIWLLTAPEDGVRWPSVVEDLAPRVAVTSES